MLTTLITTISNTSFLKAYFFSIFSLQGISLLQEVSTGGASFTEALLNNTPAQVFSVLGVVAGLIWIFRMGDNAWANHIQNRAKSKTATEKAEQVEIDTDIKRKTL